ncbi:MAG: methionyl aminopeptidase [Clostridium sp.]|uniref:methionyl aminopeptidase n=1 Tax=Clostridium sp. TaxID=1506 RepID=UPI003F3BE7AD
MKINRNDDCWCGSGKKYKKCHMEFDEKYEFMKRSGCIMPDRNLVKNKEQIEMIKKSATINNGVLDLVSENIKAGMSTNDIDKIVYDYTTSHGAIPAPLNYDGFPKSVCVSINDEVCHGIPEDNVILKDGDIVNVDVSTIKDGYFSDASRMYVVGGKTTDEAQKLVDVARECLKRGVEAVKPWGFLGDIGEAVGSYAHENGYTVVRDFGGHGVGLKFHEDPFVAHIGNKGEGMVLVPGMIFTIEPMINEGGFEVFVDADNDWTALTEDGSLSAQWEHTVLVTETGVEILAW